MNDGNLISKTRRKRQMLELQDLGEALTRLPEDQLARLTLPDDLRKAIQECRKMTKHEAVRRQLQYIGKLMRRLDSAPVAAQLEAMQTPSREDTVYFHRAERWRKDLLEDPLAVARFQLEYPQADADRLRELSAAAREERESARPPRHYRELFRILDAIIRDHEKRQLP